MMKLLLYYKYTHIVDHELYTLRHLKFCKALGVKGRILIASEGINGTLSGTKEQTDAYIHAMHMDQRFSDMEFKIDDVKEHAFKKLYVRVRSEIVTLNLKSDIDPNTISGKHLTPKKFFEEMQKEDVLILDARNNYEYDLGHFKNAVKADVNTFKEFPSWIQEHLDKYKDKKILAYCTGGVRCEKLSGLLIREGFKDVNQLHGGIINYSKDPEMKGRSFEGKCYVFDERISVPVNFAEEPVVVSSCYFCGDPCDRYVNCAHLNCHCQFICCSECDSKNLRSCSEECRKAEHHEFKLAR
jgi:UPF0176 protein